MYDYIRFNKKRLQKHLSGDCLWVQRQQGRWKVQCCLLCLCKAFLYTESPLLNGIWSSKIAHTHHTSAKQFKTTDLPPPVGPTIIVECLDNMKAFWVRNQITLGTTSRKFSRIIVPKPGEHRFIELHHFVYLQLVDVLLAWALFLAHVAKCCQCARWCISDSRSLNSYPIPKVLVLGVHLVVIEVLHDSFLQHHNQDRVPVSISVSTASTCSFNFGLPSRGTFNPGKRSLSSPWKSGTSWLRKDKTRKYHQISNRHLQKHVHI